MFGETFLELCRGRKHDINLDKVDSLGSARVPSDPGDAFIFHVPAERKDDKRIDWKVFERADNRNQLLTWTFESRIPNRAGSPRMRLSISLVFPTHNAPLSNTGRVP